MDKLTHAVEETQLQLTSKEEMLSAVKQSKCQLQKEVEHLSVALENSEKRFLINIMCFIIHI